MKLIKKQTILTIKTILFTLAFFLVVTPRTDAAPAFSGIHVSGNKIINEQGEQVILHGVNIMSTEYMCVQAGGIFDKPSDAAAVQRMKAANINAVAVLLNESCWLGINGANPGGAEYQTAIKNWVDLLTSNEIYTVIGYMWGAPGSQKASGHPNMPNADHAPAFWTSVANTFKNNPTAIFRLQQEPHPAGLSWDCWKNGGGACSEDYQVVGFQSLIQTVRATGAKNIIALSGVDYANRMERFLEFKPKDTLTPENLIATVDIYPGSGKCANKACYDQHYAPIVAQMPFMAGEFGENIECSKQGGPITTEAMDWLDAHQSGYLAWQWNTASERLDCVNTNEFLAKLAKHATDPVTKITNPPAVPSTTPPNSPFDSPGFECMGGINCIPSKTPTVAIGMNLTPPPATTNPNTITPANPCTNTSQTITANQEIMRHRRQRGNQNNNNNLNSSGLIKQLLEFFLQIINLLLQLIGGSPLPSPTPTPAPIPQPTPCEPTITTQPNIPATPTMPLPSNTIPSVTTPPMNNTGNPISPFRTIGVGSPLPSDAQCAAAVKKVPEVVSENQQANNTKGIPVNGTYLSTAINARDIEARITGNFTGTTDEILQWGACKWGFDEDNVRAQAKQESTWTQSFIGDGGASLGILQVRGNDGTFPGTMPYIQTSTAFNVDYALAVRRACFEGKETWLADKNPAYAAGDEWGCIGRWFSGDWHDPEAENYISLLEGHLATKNWPKP